MCSGILHQGNISSSVLVLLGALDRKFLDVYSQYCISRTSRTTKRLHSSYWCGTTARVYCFAVRRSMDLACVLSPALSFPLNVRLLAMIWSRWAIQLLQPLSRLTRCNFLCSTLVTKGLMMASTLAFLLSSLCSIGWLPGSRCCSKSDRRYFTLMCTNRNTYRRLVISGHHSILLAYLLVKTFIRTRILSTSQSFIINFIANLPGETLQWISDFRVKL